MRKEEVGRESSLRMERTRGASCLMSHSNSSSAGPLQEGASEWGWSRPDLQWDRSQVSSWLCGTS